MHEPASRVRSLSLLAAIALTSGGCSGDDGGKTTQTDGVEQPPDRDAGGDDECPDDNPYCDEDDDGEESDNDGDEPACDGSQTFDLEPTAVNVMIAVDGSSSMNAFWNQVQEAIERMIEASPQQNYGVHLFWGEPVSNIIDGVTRVNFCGQTQNQVLDVAPGQQYDILPFMGVAPPGMGNVFFDFTPVVEPLNYYLTHDSKLADASATNYLVFISDGNDNCFGTAFAGMGDKNLAYEKLAIELGKKHIRTLPIGFDASSNMIGVGGMVQTNFEALNTLARHGGTKFSEALAADDPAELDAALAQVAQAIKPCRFRIPAALDPSADLNPFELSFVLGGTKVPRDRRQREGWNFVEGDTSEVEFFGNACEAIQAGARLEAKKGCESDVCGQAATRVTTKPTAVLYLLDSSASMGACSGGLLDCIPKPLGMGKLTWWGVATQAISASAVAPINDHVEFGLQEFPAIGTGFGACDVAPAPEVSPAQGTEISIIGKMLADLPTGQTPLVTGLETVAGAPGRLAADEVSGAVIVVSDGGNSQSCGDVAQSDAVLRLGTAAHALQQEGVKTYAVRFGVQGSDFAEQDAQLRSIAANGGTATGDPNDPNNVPYLDAPDQAALEAALASISEGLASCRLRVGNFNGNVDLDKTNLYVNGEAVPYDASAMEGWAWSNDQRTELELHGSWCTHFKTSRVTSIVIELGCATLVVD
jgi:hypothetical protein